MTVRVLVPAGVPVGGADTPPPPPQAPPTQTRKSTAASGIAASSAARPFVPGHDASRFFWAAQASKNNSSPASAAGPSQGMPGGTLRGLPGNVNPRFVVVTVTVKGAGLAPLAVGELGETLQTAAAGAPLHVKVTVPLKPFTGLT